MARQIRIDDQTYKLLESIATRAGKPKSVCASLMIEAFEQLIESLNDDSEIIIESKGTRTQLLLPFRTDKFKMKKPT